MASTSLIQWTDATINFWTGCIKVSEGCKYCYMYRDKERYGKDPSEIVQVSEKTIRANLKKLGRYPFRRSKIFTCSWSDFFLEEADPMRPWAWEIIREHPQFDWQILTKRPERIINHLPPDWGPGWPRVWLGVSVENQARADERIPLIYNVPAQTRFLSVEPLLEKVDLGLERPGVKGQLLWVIAGGESGNEVGKYRYRPCELTWLESIVAQCKFSTIPCFIKQLGTSLAKTFSSPDRHGGDPSGWPSSIQVREFPPH